VRGRVVLVQVREDRSKRITGVRCMKLRCGYRKSRRALFRRESSEQSGRRCGSLLRFGDYPDQSRVRGLSSKSPKATLDLLSDFQMST
jgi:hypothetical protein